MGDSKPRAHPSPTPFFWTISCLIESRPGHSSHNQQYYSFFGVIICTVYSTMSSIEDVPTSVDVVAQMNQHSDEAMDDDDGESLSLSSPMEHACLKAMGVSEHWASFRRLYAFCQSKQKEHSQGVIVALGLLYTRLLVAFQSRNRILTETLDENGNLVQNEVEATNNDESVEEEKITEKDESDDDSDVEMIDPIDSVVTNVELSPEVGKVIYRVVNHLVAVHNLLPDSWSNDWTVAYVCILAQDFFKRGIRKSNSNAWKHALPHMGQSEREMFMVFSEKTTEWMAGRIVRAVEAYYDFDIVWRILMDRLMGESQEEQSRPSNTDISRNDGNESDSASAKNARLPISTLNWMPEMPHFSEGERATESQTERQVHDKENQGSSDSPSSRNTSTLASNALESRTKTVLWHLAVFNSLFLQEHQAQRILSRRQRLLSSMSSLTLFLGLRLLCSKATSESSGQDSNPKDEAPLRAIGVECMQVILGGANQECAFTRWAGIDSSIIEENLTEGELIKATSRLAGAANAFFEESKEISGFREIESDDMSTEVSSLPSWIREIYVRVGKNAFNLLWNLPKLAVDITDAFSRSLRMEKLKVEASFFLSEATLVESEDIRQTLCKVQDAPIVKKIDKRFIAIAATEKTGTMAKRPFALEEHDAKRQKLGSPSNLIETMTPATLMDSMDMTDWALAISSVQVVKPSTRLREFLTASSLASSTNENRWADVMVPILNSTLLRFTQEELMAKSTRKAAATVQSLRQGGSDEVGLVVFPQMGELTSEKALARALVCCYYHSLETILESESKRLSTTSHENLIFSEEFHRALLTCCVISIAKAVGSMQKVRPSTFIQSIRIFQALTICECSPLEYFKVSAFYVNCLAKSKARNSNDASEPHNILVSLPPLPKRLIQDFKASETSLLESLIWARESKFGNALPDLIEELFERNTNGENITWWPVEALQPTLLEETIDNTTFDPDSVIYPTATMKSKETSEADYRDYKVVVRIIEKLLKRSYQRIISLCQALDIPTASPLVNHVWLSLRYLMRSRIDLLYDRHLDHWILCCLYGVAKQIKVRPEVKFLRIVDAYIAVRGPELGDLTCQRIAYNIKLESEWGNIINLYNMVFVPAMKDYLLSSKSLQKATESVCSIGALPFQ